MSKISDLLNQYRESNDLEERNRLAEELILEVWPRLSHFLFIKLNNPQSAEDVFQTTLIGIAQNLHMCYAEDEKQFITWCYHVAWNKLRDHLRKKKIDPLSHVESLDNVDVESLRKDVVDSGVAQTLEPGVRLDFEHAVKILRKMKPPCFAYLWLRLFLLFDFNDIARMFKQSYDAARMQYNRCLEHAQDLLS